MAQKITIHNKKFVPYLADAELQEGILKVAHQINHDYKGKKPLFIAVLNGAFMFASDLLKKIEIDCEISFVKISSYAQMSSTGNIKELIGVNQSLKDKDIIVLEDIIDTGNSMVSILPTLQQGNPKSIALATLLHKPEALQHKLKIDYIAFNIPNKFVVGYGLDYDELGRNLPDLYQLEE